MNGTRRGEVITFYSFKGGVGRTMALANVAAVYAQRGKRVLALDFDFEAPGLHQYFLTLAPGQDRRERYAPEGPQQGMLNYFAALRERLGEAFPGGEGIDRESAPEELRSIVRDAFDAGEYLYRVLLKNPNVKGAPPVQLDFVAAARFDATYPDLVRDFDWQQFYDEHREVLPVLAEELASRYDVVLIDSRTGMTDIGSICTMELPDKLVLVFSANAQSLDGALDAGWQAVRAPRATREPKVLQIFPLLSRVEEGEHEQKRAWMARAGADFERLFRAAYGLPQVKLDTYFSLVRIPQKSFFSFGERVAAEEQAANEMDALAHAFHRLADVLGFKSVVEATGALEATAPLGPMPLAHLTKEGRPHLLIDHLVGVADGASRFAEAFGAAEHARTAGLWHDLGKYAAAFQNMIRAANGFEAHLEGTATGRVDHSTAGAVHATKTLGPAGTAIAFAVAGHHAGLANQLDLRARLNVKAALLDDAKRGGAPAELLAPPKLATPDPLRGATAEHRRLQELWTRMLFSALCDADFLDTEAFYDAGRAALRGGAPQVAELSARLAEHLDGLEARAGDSEVNRVRAEVRAACVAGAADPPGVFSLTVPTGGGKTLASLAFALRHAERHGLARVVVAIPFTSIIEQNAAVFRKALGDDAVVEHHSAFDPSRETAQNRVASENWDAPVIVTTTVQLFESLFANRSGACRKLHRLAKSVIVLDEAQTLPPGMLSPILDALRTLVQHFGASVVICTATQPAFHRTSWLRTGFAEIREIVPPEVRAFERLRRVRARWPSSAEPTDYPTLAAEMAGERDVLAIVHLRKDARSLCEELDRALGDHETVHLSALMCPEHRSRVLDELKERKKAGEPVRLVSTQVVEAGVDVDFAVVYRALGGMDALAQAAGRCNREGKLPGLGELRVFHAPTKPPRGVPQAALAVAKLLLAQRPDLDLFEPETYLAYFRQLYASRDLDSSKVQEARAAFDFADVASRFALIEDDWSAPLVVPHGDAAKHVDALERFGPSRGILRRLQRFTVNVSRKDRDAWTAAKLVREVAETVFVLDPVLSAAYDPRFGLVPDRLGQGDAGAYIV